MSSLAVMLQKHPFAIWICSVLVLGFVGTVVIFVSCDEFLDCSIPETHEPANTLLGWTTAAIVTGVPLLVGVVLGLRHSAKLVGAAVLGFDCVCCRLSRRWRAGREQRYRSR